ncbi:hypothetical protein N0V83_007324 [Neocucurbitaria cava]|uniref:AB hydrolase-1 domain-containing protein n=1 Tax=Neocucurbitaria cava TaxID=798079 RepID=A0A9W9CJW8_9PLEO|nr:hypothetical protein N0V83_007324 [Neocucurbitaria cava]
MYTTKTQLIELHPNVKINTISTHPTTTPPETDPLPTLVFLHFWGGSTRTWSHVLPAISPTYPTLAIDFRGWGTSTGPDDAVAYNISDLAADVQAVISALELHSVVLVGLSMGAKVAQVVAAQLSSISIKHGGNGSGDGNGNGNADGEGKKTGSALRGLILISPAPTTPLILPPEMREQQLHAYESRESATFVAQNVLTSSFRKHSQREEVPEFLVADMLRGNRWARGAWPAYAMAEDVSPAVEGKIKVPVLVIAAEEDVVEPLERVRKEVCERIEGVRLEVLEGSGHLSVVDVPEAVVEKVVEFVKGL